jgi:hypothetical protein
VAADDFLSASVAWGSERKKEGPPTGTAAWQREERGPWVWRSAARGGQQWPLAVGRGERAGHGRRGVSVADRWGRDDSRAQCQWWGAGGRGVSEAARFEMDSTIFIDSDGISGI